MTAPRYTRLASAMLAQARPDTGPIPAPPAEARAAAIGAIEKAIAGRAQARRRLRFFGAVGAAAAMAAIAAGVYGVSGSASPAQVVRIAARAPDLRAVLHPQGEGVVLVGSETPPADGATLGSGNRLVVRPQGRAMLAFATGTELVLEERADLTLVDQGAEQRFALSGGSMSAKVAKLPPGRRFTVATGDAEIEVRGTQFRVSVVESDPSCGGERPRASTSPRGKSSSGTGAQRRGSTRASTGRRVARRASARRRLWPRFSRAFRRRRSRRRWRRAMLGRSGASLRPLRRLSSRSRTTSSRLRSRRSGRGTWLARSARSTTSCPPIRGARSPRARWPSE